jgi:hypothetical protein
MECDVMEGHRMKKFMGKFTPTEDTTLNAKINSAALNIKCA